MEDEALRDGRRRNDEEPHTADERAAVQARTFTRWINVVLQRNEPPAAVRDLFADIRDGRILMALLEQLSGSQLLYRFRSPPQRIFRLKNISKVLAFLGDKQVELPGVTASGVVDGDPSVVLSLVWSIILHFQVKEVGGLQDPSSSPPLCSSDLPTRTGETGAAALPSEGRQAPGDSGHDGNAIHALLQRVQRCTSEFGVDVDDFGKSWRSGLAFLALIKSINPALVDLRASFSREPRENIQQAFTLARRSLGIAPLLEPDDVSSTLIDEPSIITYVSTFFQHCPTIHEDCPACTDDDTEANFGSLGTAFGGNLAIDPEAQALLKRSEKSCEQQLWKKWSRRASGRGNSQPPVGDGASGRTEGGCPNPPSPLDASISSQEIQSWMKTSDQSQHRMYRSYYSLSSEEGVYSLSVVESEQEQEQEQGQEEACSPILDLNRGAFQPCPPRGSREMGNDELLGDVGRTCEDESFVRGRMNDGGACTEEKDEEGTPRSAAPGYNKAEAPGGGATKIHHCEADGCKEEREGQTERSLIGTRGQVRERTKSGGGEEEEDDAAAVSRGQHQQEHNSSTRGCSGICQTFRPGGSPPEPSTAAELTPPETQLLLLLWILTYCCFILHHMIS